MKSTTPALLLFLLCMANASSAAMRCGRMLVDIGDHQIDVLHKCGYPAMMDRRTRIVGEEFHHPRRTLDLEKQEEIVIDEWIYNFGPRYFMQSLIFENGILKEIRRLGYGY
ncbi:DUF2845 domain-containing protein [Methylomarinum vadi]|uniref:DUF2845 domain-containing protein n=1 Tax=Methylomarinum vadi TaxID=438855 RepID=UPI0004DF7560|nr:DUF2845 domain-containing protein [Methylomarinum vadi]